MLSLPAIGGQKYLKAYIIGKGLAFEKVHDLVHLLKTCAAAEPAFVGLEEDCILLNWLLSFPKYPPFPDLAPVMLP